MADPFAAVLRDPILERAYRHWQGLRRGRPMPVPRDLDPVEVLSLLPFVVLTEPGESGRYRFRLAGTEVERQFGRPMTGQYVDSLLHGGYLAYIVELYDTVTLRQTPVFSRSAYGAVDSIVATRRLMLPFASDGRSVDRILTVQTFAYDGGMADRPGFGAMQAGFRGLERVVAADPGTD